MVFNLDSNSKNYKLLHYLLDKMDPSLEFNDDMQKTEFVEYLKKEILTYTKGLSKSELEVFLLELTEQAMNLRHWENAGLSEIERIQNRLNNINTYYDTIRKVQTELMLDTGIRKLQSATFSMYLQRNSKAPLVMNENIDLEDIDSLPAKYIKYEPKIDFAKIREDAEAGKCNIATIGEKGEGIRYRQMKNRNRIDYIKALILKANRDANLIQKQGAKDYECINRNYNSYR